MALIIGSVLERRYKIEKKLGEGGFGAVYQAIDTRLNVICAIKESFKMSEDAIRQFRREAEMLAKLRHPNLPRVTDYFDTPNGFYLVMDFIEGKDLQTVLVENDAPLPVDQSLEWVKQICDALIYIHGQNPPIIHRDIKPANIRITLQNKAVLVDFGLAKTFDDGVKTTIGARGLTPHFAAPEQYGMGSTDAQSDIYSLGVTLYLLLTFRLPPDSVEIMVGNANSPLPAKEVNKNISDSISAAIQHAMQIRRTERCKSASDFKSTLKVEGKVKSAPPAQSVHSKYFVDYDYHTGLYVVMDNLDNRIATFKTQQEADEYLKKYLESSTAKEKRLAVPSTKPKKFIFSNGMEFMNVPAGKFVMGSEKNQNERPRHEVEIPYEYWTARYPITNEQYSIYVKEKGSEHPAKDWGKKKNHPVVNIKWTDAVEYCKWLTNTLKSKLPSGMIVRLSTEAEWEKSARGADGWEYPWGNTFDKNKCNSQEGRKNSTTAVGQYSPEGDSPCGCSDMAGNIWEWTHSLNLDYPYNPNDGRENKQSDLLRVLRGGSYDDGSKFICCSTRYWDVPTYWYNHIGFRVVVAPAFEEEKKSAFEISALVRQPVQIKGIPATPSSNKLALSNGMEFMRVSAGKFLMGSDNDISNERPQHTVDIPYDYWLARFPVTNELYNFYVKSRRISHPVDGWKKKKDHPVVNINWNTALEYCGWLNNLLKTELPSGLVLRLPTEAEWEKAARGSDGREYPWGNKFDGNKCNADEVGNEDGISTPVGYYSPHGDSPYGCADMAGNIWEWTHSLDKTYPYNLNDGREDQNTNDNWRIIRGGSFYNDEWNARCAFRLEYDALSSYNILGFRVVASIPLPKSDSRETEELYRKTIKDDPNNATAHKNLGVFLQNHNRIQEAENAYRKAIEIDSKFATAFNNLGVLLKTQNRFLEAEEAYRKAIEINPEYASACFNLGLLLSYQNRTEESSKWIKKAIALNPSLEKRLKK